MSEKGDDESYEQLYTLPYVSIDNNTCKNQNDWDHVADHYSNIPNKENFKTIIINFGTPGSGKSTSSNIVKRFASGYFGRIHEWENISHDDYVLKDDRYREGLNELLLKRTRRTKREARENLEQTYNEIRKGIHELDDTPVLIEDLWNNEHFWDDRDDDEFSSDELIYNGTRILVYDKIIKAINEGKNIIYEALGNKLTTIMKIFETVKKYKCSNETDRYFIILTYNSINVEENKKRLNDRWRTGLETLNAINKEGKEDIPDSVYDKLPKPWLYNDDTTLNKLNTEILNTLNHIVENCYDSINTDGKCSGIGPDILVIFDKNKKDIIDEPISYTIPLSERGTVLHRWKNVKRRGHFNIVKKEGDALKTFMATLINDIAGYKTKKRKNKKVKQQTKKHNIKQKNKTANKKANKKSKTAKKAKQQTKKAKPQTKKSTTSNKKSKTQKP
jgi:hypothetical protein